MKLNNLEMAKRSLRQLINSEENNGDSLQEDIPGTWNQEVSCE